jgi:hypothetical protein
VKYVEGFAEDFEELLIKIAMEEGLESMVASTVITIGSYDDAVEYQDEEKAFAEHEVRMGEFPDVKLSLPCDFITC